MSDDNTVPPVQLSTFQRILGFVRFWLDVRANITVVLSNQSQLALANQNLVAHVRRLNARLDWYEHQVPLLGKAGASFRAHERKLMESAAAQENYAEREARRAADSPKPQLEIVGR